MVFLLKYFKLTQKKKANRYVEHLFSNPDQTEYERVFFPYFEAIRPLDQPK